VPRESNRGQAMKRYGDVCRRFRSTSSQVVSA
jgi:hypothetical protein